LSKHIYSAGFYYTGRPKIVFFIYAALFVLIFCPASKSDQVQVSICVEGDISKSLHGASIAVASEVLKINGFSATACSNVSDEVVEIVFGEFFTKKEFNYQGLLLAGGVSSAMTKKVWVGAHADARSKDVTIFEKDVREYSSPHNYYSAWRKTEGIKKRLVEKVTSDLIAEYLKCRFDIEKVKVPVRGNGDFLTEDSDLWPFLGGGFTALGIHEVGHHISARLAGHDAEFEGNDSRVFNIGLESVFLLSALWTHHIGDDQLLPLLPDVTYDFYPVDTSHGREYFDENGMPLSHGKRDRAFIIYSGIMFQNLTNEILLTEHPDLIDIDRPFQKGMFFSNIIIPAFYTFQGYSDPNSDLLLLQKTLEWDRWAVNAMVILPSAIDLYRYYHPEKKSLRRVARIAKIIPVIICLSQ